MTCRPVEYVRQIDEAAIHWDVGRVHRPDLVRLVDGDAAQQIGVDPMRGIAPTSVGLPVERLDTHLLHQRRNVLAADLEAWSALNCIRNTG